MLINPELSIGDGMLIAQKTVKTCIFNDIPSTRVKRDIVEPNHFRQAISSIIFVLGIRLIG